MDYEAETRAAILELLRGFTSQRALAKRLMLKPVTLNDLLLGKPMSDARLNEIRDALMLPRVKRIPVLLDADNEYVGRKSGGKPRKYREFKVRVSHDIGHEIDNMLADGGWKSFSEWWLAEHLYGKSR